MSQLTLDFSPKPVDFGKMVPISISIPAAIKELIELWAKIQNKKLSECCFPWVVNGFTEELGKQTLIQPLLSESLRSLLQKKF